MTETERRIVAAQGYVELGLYEEARQVLHSLPAEMQDRVEVIELLLLCLMGECRWSTALELTRKLCEVEPNEPGGFIHAAYCLHELGRTQEAVDMLLAGPDSLQSKAVYFYNMGCYRARLGEIDAAMQLLQKAFDKDESLRRVARKDPDLESLRARLEMI